MQVDDDCSLLVGMVMKEWQKEASNSITVLRFAVRRRLAFFAQKGLLA